MFPVKDSLDPNVVVVELFDEIFERILVINPVI